MSRRTATASPSSRLPWLWASLGAGLGLAAALLAFLPAAWVAERVNRATEGRLQLLEADGTLWQGSALALLTGGPGSPDASVLPSRLEWTLSPVWGGLRLDLRQSCCMPEGVSMTFKPGWQSSVLTLAQRGRSLGEWPAAWLQGLGAPWNTLKPGGQLKLSSPGLTLRGAGSAWQIEGTATLDLLRTSSRLTTLDPMGSYRLVLTGAGAQPAQVQLLTLDGALRLQGRGEWRPNGLYFRGDAQAQNGEEQTLNALLNLIGRRQGALSVISYG
jgi:general secretion pathway protein N